MFTQGLQAAYTDSEIVKKSQKGQYDRFKEPEELTRNEVVILYVLEKEIAEDEKKKPEERMDPDVKRKMYNKIVEIREKERFKELKEASQEIKIGDGFKEVEKDKDRIKALEKSLTEENLSPAQKAEKISQLQELRNNEIPFDGEQLKVFIKDIIEAIKHPELKKFIEEACVFDLDKSSTTGLSIDTQAISDKFQIKISPQVLMEESKIKALDDFGIERVFRFFNPERVAVMLGRVLGHIFLEPDNWEKYKPQIPLTEQGELGSWADFVLLCVVNPLIAEKLAPDAYRVFRENLDGLKTNEIKLRKEKTVIGKEKLVVDFPSGDEPDKVLKKGETLQRNFLMRFIKRFSISDKFLDWAVKWGKIKKIIWNRSEWFQRAIAEYEDKEVSRIMVQNPSLIERDLSMLLTVNDGGSNIGWENRFRLRTTLLADMKLSDCSDTRIHAYLQASDWLYRDSKGEMITEDSYYFMMRLHRLSNASHRIGTKPIEYTKVEVGEEYEIFRNNVFEKKIATDTIYIRKSRDHFQTEALEEVAGFTNREITSCAKETYIYLKINEKLTNIHEKWQDKDSKEFDYQTPTGDWVKFLGKGFADKMLSNYNAREILPKLEVDQIAIMARLIAEEIKVDSKNAQFGYANLNPAMKKIAILGGEHAKQLLVEAYYNYRPQFLEDDQFRKYINYYLNPIGLETDENGLLHAYYGKHEGDQDIVKAYQDVEEKRGNRFYKESNDIIDKFQGKNQDPDENVDWQKDQQGNYEDQKSNELKKSFILERSENDICQDLGVIEQSVDGYMGLIATRIANSQLSNQIKEIVRDLALGSNEVYIAQDVEDLVSGLEAGLLSESEQKKVKKTVVGLINELRPFRKELIRSKKLLKDLGIEFLGTKKPKDYKVGDNYYVKIDSEKNFQHQELLERTKDTGLLLGLRKDSKDLFNNLDNLSQEELIRFSDEIKESDEKTLARNKNIFQLIPSKVLELAKNPDGKYDKTHLKQALKYVNLFIERKINSSTKEEKDKASEESKKDAGQEAPEPPSE